MTKAETARVTAPEVTSAVETLRHTNTTVIRVETTTMQRNFSLCFTNHDIFRILL